MKKFYNGVRVLSKLDITYIKNLVAQGYRSNAGNVVVSLNPKNNHRGKKIEIVEVYLNRDSSKLFVWYRGYHYRFINSSTIEPLNLRKKRVVRFYKNLKILGKKRMSLDKLL